jgi:hypothetical protein
MMFQMRVKTLAIAIAFSLANANATEATLTQPCSYEGLIQFNQQIYYSGDQLVIHLSIPDKLKVLLKEDAEAHILVYFPQGEIEAFPVVNEGQLLEATIESTAIVTGTYQLALVFTQRSGDATQIRDWYNGFAGLTSFGHFKISSGVPGSEAEDVDGDGLLDNQGKDSVVEATDTVSVCVVESALTRQADIVNQDSFAASAKPIFELELNLAMTKVLKVFSELKMLTHTYHAEMGHFPATFDEISPYLAKENRALVASIQLNAEAPFYYQLTLNNDLEPALAGKTLQFSYEPTTNIWSCRSGQPNGLESQYLPEGCRH